MAIVRIVFGVLLAIPGAIVRKLTVLSNDDRSLKQIIEEDFQLNRIAGLVLFMVITLVIVIINGIT